MNIPVTVVGLGPMGRATARVLHAAGHPTTVWNRTPGRAGALVAAGARVADSPAAALRASELVVLSLTDYQAMYDILGDTDLTGRVLVNLSSDTPARTREAADWASGRGARFVAGGVMVPAPLVGTDAAYVYYSGDLTALDEYSPVLRVIGTPRILGADPALAQLYYQAQLDIFLTALAAYLHATALVGTAGVSAAEFAPWAADNLDSLSAYLPAAAAQIDRGEHPGTLSTVRMMGATAAHITEASRAAGLDTALPAAVRRLYDRAVAAGHGADNWTSLVDAVRTPDVPS
ncbi:MAG TPA: NAD(P)-binding domain-containing protein [Actinocatenispora sp.]